MMLIVAISTQQRAQWDEFVAGWSDYVQTLP